MPSELAQPWCALCMTKNDLPLRSEHDQHTEKPLLDADRTFKTNLNQISSGQKNSHFLGSM